MSDKIAGEEEHDLDDNIESRSIALPGAEGLQRRLNNRQVQLLAIGGSIGTALFITIGNAVAAGGPASLLIAFTVYCGILACVSNCAAEMTTYMPVEGGFITLAGHWFDDALGFMVGWNFFLYEAVMVPFEITAINLLLKFWSDNVPPVAICIVCIVLYAAINFMAVGVFGEAEFWLSLGKVILIFILMFFTFVTMVGGNPQGDAYGFRYWSTPGAFATYRSESNLGRFEGFLKAIWIAAFTIVGPEYISMAAAEAKSPRIIIKNAYKTIYWRFCLFFIMGAICVGIVVPWNDPTLQALLNGTSEASGAAASPYVIAMTNMQIEGLPHLVNALLLTSIFSAGNTLFYCATRSLYGLAITGRAPSVLKRTMRGVPVYCFVVTLCFSFLSFLQLSNNSSEVIGWLVSIVTAGGLINFIVICLTYLNWYRACNVQGFDRQLLPYYARFQPYSAWIGLISLSVIVVFYGYAAFAPWSVAAFFQNYTMQIIAPILYFGWKFIKKTKMVKPSEMDLVWQAPVISAYEATVTEPVQSFWGEIVGLVGIRRKEKPSQSQG
ncbi:unnamed protein product [Clonostachys rhizophaga]|uniref:Amino acid permease/ SLC12A domain-containing protein n=1 Tax=Clonostachys rhizophaga TaxID=160324 RepID=A0A9N9VR33_9HYPO|nr:unnamed protein product [Clonostachys rhizophaga]